LTGQGAVGLLWLMLDNSSAPVPASHVVGESYDFHSIRTAMGGEANPPFFVIHRDGVILGLCLGLLWNPRAESAPAEVWVGRKGDLPKWGEKLADTTGPLPVYVRREEGGKWFYLGRHEVTGSSTDLNDIRSRLKPPVITGISRIVYLKRLAAV
jgi:hypothetical protein